ncbi:glutathione S-transferase family protein [Enterobacter sichuanensis]|uniref:Glutathione S-transferase family protein n=1 Tax=Enterobacter sichuanensis TaxID=2071710 RepID=A0ABS6GDT9_9ENTR|nr:glutathione S-transferase family protein [Enterobacter sichuanensis]MBU5924218.1 glutathione S-transferase family protein [Enterobacter sichuanensis]OZV00795.1 glutathione S-transferase [Enterobacter cloacae]PAO13930.1 glutathione S-transferase [Enterobacter cloacae]
MIKLIGMMDSPYVRRVAVSLELYGVAFESQPLSVFSTFEEFSRINPAVKAPTLVLDNGTRLMDSSLILNYFEAQAAPERRLLPVAPDALANDLQTLGFILAAAEKAVQNVYEHHLRPAEKQHSSWVERITVQLLAACKEWNTLLETRPVSTLPDQVAITSTVVWTFIQSMIPHVVNAADFRKIQAVTAAFEAQAVFKKYPFN